MLADLHIYGGLMCLGLGLGSIHVGFGLAAIGVGLILLGVLFAIREANQPPEEA